MKKLTAFLLSFSCIFAVCGFSACDEENSTPPTSTSESVETNSATPTVEGTEGLVYSLTYLNGKEAYIVTDYFGADTNVVIPATIAGKEVVAIGKNAFDEQDTLISVIIPDSVTTIGASAFSACSSLTSVNIPNSVTTIESRVFHDCSSLTEIVIPDGVTYIGGSAFSGCSSLTKITVPDGVTYIGGSAFSGCSITQLSIPNNVTYIGDYAFDCDNLQYTEYNNGYYLGNATNPHLVFIKVKDISISSYTIHNSAKFIHSYAFYNCSNLTKVSIHDGVTSIGAVAFSGCTSLEEIVIPNSVTSISSSAFMRCIYLTRAIFNNPNGWTIGATEISAEELANPETAAMYLQGYGTPVASYGLHDWTRN